MSGVNKINILFFKLKLKNKLGLNLSLNKSNEYAEKLIENSNATLEDLIKFSNLSQFSKPIFLKKLLETNNLELIVGYLDFLLDNENLHSLIGFNELFKIYLRNTNRDITNFVLSNYRFMDLDMLLYIFDYFFENNKFLFNKLLCNRNIFEYIINYFDKKKIDYIKKYILTLVQNGNYNIGEQMMNVLTDMQIVDYDYVIAFEKSILNLPKDNNLCKYIIKYYKRHSKDNDFNTRGIYMLNSIIENAHNDDIYILVKFLLDNGEFDKAIYFSRFISISDNQRDLVYYSNLLRLQIPIAKILESDIYLDKKLILNVIKNDKFKLYIYGESIINGYNFDDKKKNEILDNKYMELIKGNIKGIYNSYEKIEEKSNRINSIITKINRYNAFFQKSVG